MASDIERASISLALASETANAALLSLNEARSSPAIDGGNPSADISVLRSDFLNILLLIKGSTTKVSLALNPNKPTYSASVAPLKDVSDQLSALSHCIRLFDPQKLGKTFVNEVDDIVRDVTNAVKDLVQTFIAYQSSPQETPPDAYLIRVGTVHSIIDQAQSSGSVSNDNRHAVKKLLEGHRNLLKDATQELQEMIEESESDNDFDDDFDDGWDELGIPSGGKMTAIEIQQAKKIQPVLRFVGALHDRILKGLSTPQSAFSTCSASSLDPLVDQSDALPKSFDDIVASLYHPQKPLDVQDCLRRLKDAIQSLEAFGQTVLESTSSKDDVNEPSQEPKWFTNCFGQIYKAIIFATDIVGSISGT